MTAQAETAPAPAPEQKPSLGRRFIDELTTANNLTVTVLAVVLALVLGAFIIVLSDEDVLSTFSYLFQAPGDSLSAMWTAVAEAYGALFRGAVFDPETVREAIAGNVPWSQVFYPISETLTNAAPLICAGLAVALAFRAGLFNIGAEGQVILGAIAAGMAGFALSLPPVLHLVVALLAGMVGGGLWGLVPGWLKARTGAHEVITTIMLNYVAYSLLVYLLGTRFVQQPGRTDAISKPVGDNAKLPRLLGWFDSTGTLRVSFGILLALAAAAAVAWLLQRSTVGFEFRAVGANPDAARTAGMSVGKAYALAMLLSGSLAGLGGATLLLGTSHAMTTDVSADVGFDGITVALLGRARPVGVVFAGLLFGGLRAGAVRMQGEAGIPVDLVSVLQALIVIFIAAPALVKAIFRLREQRVGALGPTVAKGW